MAIREVKFESQDIVSSRLNCCTERAASKTSKRLMPSARNMVSILAIKLLWGSSANLFRKCTKWAYVGVPSHWRKVVIMQRGAAEAAGIGLRSFLHPGFCLPVTARLVLDTEIWQPVCFMKGWCFCFLAGHESLQRRRCNQNCCQSWQGSQRTSRCILNGLGKDAAQIISRINSFTYVKLSLITSLANWK